jgi:hypothetical protein
MTTHAHTPGPWKYANGLVATNMHKIAELPPPGFGLTPFDVTANGQLLAAAPDLLAICREIADDPRCDLVTAERRAALYHAITQATGGHWA